MTFAAAGAVALAAALDRLFAEPPARLHPVAWLGSAVAWFDDRLPDTPATGVAFAVLVPLFAAVVAAGGVVVAGVGHPVFPAVAAGLVLSVAISHRMLVETAREVAALADTNLDAAREELRALAGRDAAALSAGQVRSAAVESAAENLADGLVAPLGAFVVVVVLAAVAGVTGTTTLALAAGAAAWVKAVNTLDSMLGYPHRGAGGPPARLDDAVMWLPARASALLLVAVSTPRTPLRTLRRARTAARVPSSPNSGWPMATLAAVLGCRFEKPNTYTLFGDRPLPDGSTADEGVDVVSRAGWLAVLLSALSVLVVGVSGSA
ncbi:cobalamin biosynthesis protein [Halorubrum gandharaense]